MPPGMQTKVLELGGHKGTLCCDWSSANQSGTCITGGAEGKARVSTLLSPWYRNKISICVNSWMEKWVIKKKVSRIEQLCRYITFVGM